MGVVAVVADFSLDLMIRLLGSRSFSWSVQGVLPVLATHRNGVAVCLGYVDQGRQYDRGHIPTDG